MWGNLLHHMKTVAFVLQGFHGCGHGPYQGDHLLPQTSPQTGESYTGALHPQVSSTHSPLVPHLHQKLNDSGKLRKPSVKVDHYSICG